MLKDTKITKAIINERKELAINILIKEWDYTPEEHELLRMAKIEGNSIDWTLEGFWKADNDEELKKARQQLWLVMTDYAMKFHKKPDDVTQELYAKYRINSRTELTLVQLQYEIDSYQTAIRTETP